MPQPRDQSWKARLADFGMVLFGLIMAITPLALWVAPSKAWFYAILELFAISSIMVCVLAGYETSAADHQRQQKTKQSIIRRLAARMRSVILFRRRPPVDSQIGKLADKHRRQLRHEDKTKP